MKTKYFIALAFFATVFFTNCRKAALVGPDSCLERIEGVSIAAQNYVADPTVNNCKSYVEALRKYLESNSCFGNIYFEEYRKTLNELEEVECK